MRRDLQNTNAFIMQSDGSLYTHLYAYEKGYYPKKIYIYTVTNLHKLT